MSAVARFWERRHVAEVVPVAISLLIGLGATIVDIDDGNPLRNLDAPSAGDVLLVVAGSLALLGRRRFPVPVLIVVAALRVTMSAGIGDEFALLPAALVALFTVARSEPRRVSLSVALGGAALMALLVAAFDADESFAQEVLGELALGLLPVAIADGARSRADRLRDLIDSEAEARVQAERLRIARDLHDVVAHGLSTIAVQSGVASHLLDRNPGQAREALDIINTTGKQSLEELRSMVGVLRSTDEAPLMPTAADPNDLSSIIDGARNSGGGIDVEVVVDGAFPPDASEASVVAVHRILSEALANIARHGGGAGATVELTHRSDGVAMVVSNEAPTHGTPTDHQPSTGVGIIGMTERAESLGGFLRAEASADGGFVLTAQVPYHREPADGWLR